MNLKTPRLSKSRINAFLQCPKRLWLEVNKPELKEVSASTETAFAIGHRVGEVARAQHPKGVLVGHDTDLSAAVAQTTGLLKASPRLPIFEATFRHEGVLVRADLMLPVAKGWHMAEVKSSGQPKPYHLNDLAVQAWVTKEAGVPVARATVRHVDTSFVYPGGGDYRGLLVDTDLGAELKEQLPQVPQWVKSARDMLRGGEPARDVGVHCEDPFPCPFHGYCESKSPPAPAYPVGLLPGKGKKLAAQLQAEGFADLTKVPADRVTDAKLRRIRDATVTGVVFRDAAGAAKALRAWKHPIGYLDFETISFVVPIWEGTRPYEGIPFQWSCHIVNREGRVEHREFLDLSGANPARACAEQLVRDLAGCRTIVAYSAGFEKGAIARLAHHVPSLRKELKELAGRIVDLLPVVREHYYHRDMLGSYSIKAVLPTLGGAGYSDLDEVQDGMAAQRAYVEAVHPDTKPERKVALAGMLREYCGLDTEAMIRVAKALVR